MLDEIYLVKMAQTYSPTESNRFKNPRRGRGCPRGEIFCWQSRVNERLSSENWERGGDKLKFSRGSGAKSLPSHAPNLYLQPVTLPFTTPNRCQELSRMFVETVN